MSLSATSIHLLYIPMGNDSTTALGSLFQTEFYLESMGIIPNSQSKPALVQLEATSSPVVCYLEE